MSAGQLDHAVPLLQQGLGQNDCGPHAAAMAIGFYRPQECDATLIGRQMRFLRVPLVGATLPWGVTYAIRRHGLRSIGGWLQTGDALRRYLDQGRPVIVIVRPSDFSGCPWYALHYRVVVGYHGDSTLPGGGEFYFNCSATSPDPGRLAPGNLTIDYRRFASQWRTYVTWNWAVAVA